MPALNRSGSATTSSSITLSAPPSPRLKHLSDSILDNDHYNPRVAASNIIEYIASRGASSSTVYLYDLAEQAGFGTLTEEWSKYNSETAPVVKLQTRAGAGLSLAGRLSGGTSQDSATGALLTAYTTPTGICMMAPALLHLPPASASSRLVVQVPRITPVGDTFALSPTLAPLASIISILPENIVLLLSATPQQSVDFASLSYNISTSHVIHLFDHHSSSREIGHSITSLTNNTTGSAATVLNQAGYQFFDYAGDKDARTVLVVLNGPLALIAQAFANRVADFGVITVNVLRPWDEAALREVIPQNASTIHVLDDVPNVSTQGNLYVDVFSTLLDGNYNVTAHRITPAQTQEYLTVNNAFTAFLGSVSTDPTHPLPSLYPPNMKKLLLLSNPLSPLSSVSHIVEDLFLSNKNIASRLLTDHDAFSKPGGITANRLLLAPQSDMKDNVPIPGILPFDPTSAGEVDFLGILDQSLLKSHSVVKYAKPGSSVLLVTSWTLSEFSSTVPAGVISLIRERDLRTFNIDAKAIASKLIGSAGPENDAIQSALVHLAFLRLYLGKAAKESTVLKIAQIAFDDTIYGIPLAKINAHAWSSLENLRSNLWREFEFNAIAVEIDDTETVVNGARLGSWHDAAKHLLFPAVYSTAESESDVEFSQNPALRPEVPDRTFLVTCTVNRRLTPLEYDRNVFHLEFDTNGTGLKYSIGEALGVHGWNDEKEVLDFCAWYGVDPDRLITIPVAGGDGKMHTRTVLQALQQQVDLFGHPPKSFYTDLAGYATNSVDKHTLQFIGSPEGSSTFKKLSEKDTITFADVLMRHKSARPGIERLCDMVGDIKPRHYSIASAQSVVGNRVDLLVVTVDWLAPSGTPRYGQCTRYLAGLRVGQKVTVSIKPSVMKLPPDVRQPIIMAGLGTGAAPFRAFLQHLAWLSEQGQEIGPVYYYFGSRHQSQEYLYGEEIEAFILDGVISRAGLAFSRDGPNKVYIQHKMLEDSEILAQMLHDDNGVFYLCGPTWPVPDVYEALVGALVKYKGSDPEKAGAYIESLKEEERYVLEVY
ncbi:assimilatory sulfite reductase [Infundibulicybe gibba]|nr:assimilatory sulfite reductase [Infundibulicybe gibba]